MRHGDSAGLCDAFKPRGDIDAIAENIVVIDNHVAEVDADPKLDPPVLGNSGVAGRHIPLDFGGAFDRIHDARKLDQHSVAGQLDDSALMLGNGRVDQFRAMAFEVRQCADLISAHQAAVTDNVGGHDRGKSAFHQTTPNSTSFT